MGKRVRARKLIKVEEWQDESVECSGKCVDRLAGTQSICGFRSRRPGADTSHLCVAVPQRNSRAGVQLPCYSSLDATFTKKFCAQRSNGPRRIVTSCPGGVPREAKDTHDWPDTASRARRRKWHVR